MPASKRNRNDDDQENMDLTATKTRRTTTNQAHQVSSDVATPGPPPTPRRSGRVPIDGVAKLVNIEKAIRPDLYQDPKQPSTKGAIPNLPDSMPVNPMAPVKKTRAGLSKKAPVGFRSVAPDPPSAQHTPETTPREPGSRFGFSPGIKPQAPTLGMVSEQKSMAPPPRRISKPVQYHSTSYSQSTPSQEPAASVQPHTLGMQQAPHHRPSYTTSVLSLPHVSYKTPHSATASNPRHGIAASSDEDSPDEEMEDMGPVGVDSTGSRGDGSEDEERGDLKLPDFDFDFDTYDRNNDSHGSKAHGASSTRGVSRPPLRPQSPSLEDGFDISPDEDERRAQAVLDSVPKRKGGGRRVPGAATTTLDTSGDHSYNILENHHRKNGAPRPPDPDMLKATHANSQDAPEPSPSVSTPGPRVQRLQQKKSEKSNAQIGGHPTQLQFYPPLWRDVLESAKANFRLYLTTNKPFPNRKEGVAEAADCISDALSKRRDVGKRVEDGYLEEHKDNMAILVFEDASNFRGELKTLARQIVESEYDLFFPYDVGHNSEDAPKYTAYHVELYLKDGCFLTDEVLDSEGRTKNVQHKAIGELVRAFYHQKKKMGLLFPDEFGETTPNPAVSLVGCAILCCLQEWKSGQRINIPFTGEAFNHECDKILDVIAQVEADDYHGPSYQNAKKLWAMSGLAYSCGSDGAELIQNEFKPVLD